MTRKPMTEQQRQRIKLHIKNGLDISDLIADYSIRKEDLSGAIITKFNRAYDDMSDVNLTRCVIGLPNTTNNISHAKLRRSRWCDTIVKGVLFARKCDCRDADFSGASLTNVEYQFCNFRGAKFCETFLRIGSDFGWGAEFDEKFFSDLARGWNVKITPLTEEEIKQQKKKK